MQVRLALLADAANVSQEGSLNILGIFNELKAANYPARHPACVLIVSLDLTPSEQAREHTMSIVYMDADGQRLTEIEGRFRSPVSDPPGRIMTVNNILALRMLPLPQPGDYSFSILVNGTEVDRATFRATIAQPS